MRSRSSRTAAPGVQRRDRDDLLTIDAQWLAAGEQQVDAGRAGRDCLHQRGDLVEDVLAVVEHQQLGRTASTSTIRSATSATSRCR